MPTNVLACKTSDPSTETFKFEILSNPLYVELINSEVSF